MGAGGRAFASPVDAEPADGVEPGAELAALSELEGSDEEEEEAGPRKK
jgi:hypothetical protein